MRLVTFRNRDALAPSTSRIGALVHDDAEIVDFTALHPGQPEFASMLEFIRAGDAALDVARKDVQAARASDRGLLPASQATLLSPLPNPPLMRDWGMMAEHALFFVHAAAAARAAREPDPKAAMEKFKATGQLDLPKNYFTVPRFYTANPLNIIGPDAVIEWPRSSDSLDYELELGLVIGKTGKDIPSDRAREHMFGLTLFNDLTARDVQQQEGSAAGKSKDFDGSYILGPCIATLDEFDDIYDISVRTRLNGEQKTESSTKTLRITFERLIEYISESNTLHAGEIFGTGTFQNGCGVETGRLLRDGDVIELEAERIGTLRNTVRRSPKPVH
jgi:2-keto-4-pentenoate hydratase/2-oxohepta-3-ene-1,7-dioic acid hydratase in catechol pathway